MSSTLSSSLTEGLLAWNRDAQTGAAKFLPLVYEDLRRMARQQLRKERPGHTLQPTALVHEVYLRLCGRKSLRWQNRRHFFAVAGRTMNCVLVDHARGRGRQRRGGGVAHCLVDEAFDLPIEDAGRPGEALEDALAALEQLDPQKAAIVDLRFFFGLSVAETGAALGCSTATVVRQWRLARAWLFRELRQAAGDES